MVRNVWLVAPVSFALISSQPLMAQDAPPAPPSGGQEKTYVLANKFAVGDLLKYKTQMTMNMQSKGEKAGGDGLLPTTSVSSTGVVKMKTVGVKPDGTGVVSLIPEEMKMMVGGQAQEMPPTPSSMVEIDKVGRAKFRNTGASDANPLAAMFGGGGESSYLPSVRYPDKPVKVGDSWESEVEVPKMDMKMKVVSTLVGVEEIDGKTTLKIKQISTLPMNMRMDKTGQPTKDVAATMMTMTGDMKVNAILNINETDGRVVKQVTAMETLITMNIAEEMQKESPFGSKMTMDMKMTTTLQLTSVGKIEAAKPVTRKPDGAKPTTSRPKTKKP